MVQDTNLDGSSTKDTALSSSAKVLAFYAEKLGLSDPWRFNFPSTKAYYFIVYYFVFAPTSYIFSDRFLSCR